MQFGNIVRVETLRYLIKITGVQLSVVTEKLNVVTDGVGESWAWLPMEPPVKGWRGHTFAHIEYVLVAIFKLSDYINQNI